MPGGNPVPFALIVTIPGVVPAAGDTVNQDTFADAVYATADPVLETVTFRVPVPLKTNTAGVTVIWDTAVTSKVTATVFAGDPVAATVIAPVYVPGAKPAGFAVTVSVPGAVPETGDAVSHPAFEDAVNGNAAPVVETVTLLVPAPSKTNAAGATEICGGATFNVTAIACGAAPGAVNVTVPA